MWALLGAETPQPMRFEHATESQRTVKENLFSVLVNTEYKEISFNYNNMKKYQNPFLP